jgi:hypothetical protein
MRRAEVCNLKVEDIDSSRMLIPLSIARYHLTRSVRRAGGFVQTR